MDDPGTMRRKAARFFENAASSRSACKAERLNEVGRRLELWADEPDETAHAAEQKTSKARNKAKAE
jgi:hypothetical protein